MKDLLDDLELQNLQPNQEKFGNDPFGYAGCTWVQFVLAAQYVGVTDSPNPDEFPTSEDLKRPSLWFSQSMTLSLAGFKLLELEPEYSDSPVFLHGMRDSQFRAIGLMLIGYSLEVTLKGMLIVKEGIDAYAENEKQYFTHDLVKLAVFIPGLNDKDKAILVQFTHFLTWAGRYPDPGSKRIKFAAEIHELSEKYQITMGDVVELADKVSKHVAVVVSENRDDAA